jgi:hypothetical protein
MKIASSWDLSRIQREHKNNPTSSVEVNSEQSNRFRRIASVQVDPNIVLLHGYLGCSFSFSSSISSSSPLVGTGSERTEARKVRGRNLGYNHPGRKAPLTLVFRKTL